MGERSWFLGALAPALKPTSFGNRMHSSQARVSHRYFWPLLMIFEPKQSPVLSIPVVFEEPFDDASRCGVWLRWIAKVDTLHPSAW